MLQIKVKGGLIYWGRTADRSTIVDVLIADKIAQTNGYNYAETFCRDNEGEVLNVDEQSNPPYKIAEEVPQRVTPLLDESQYQIVELNFGGEYKDGALDPVLIPDGVLVRLTYQRNGLTYTERWYTPKGGSGAR